MRDTIILMPILFLLLISSPLGPAYASKDGDSLKNPDGLIEATGQGEGEISDIELQEARFKLFKEHTQKYYDIVKDDTEALNSIISDVGKKDIERLPELKTVLNDYNSFMDGLSLMLRILKMKDMLREDSLEEYYREQAENHEKIKYGFSIKNEVFLNRIDRLDDQQARSYEQALLEAYREYCMFDINRLLPLKRAKR